MFLTILALATTANAFETIETSEFETLRWDEFPVEYLMDFENLPAEVNDAVYYDATEASFEEWTAVAGSQVDFRAVGETVAGDSAHDGLNIVFWEPDWDWDPEILALTSTWSTTDGKVVGFDIRINSGTVDWTGMDLQNALTHEVGHALGLDHTQVDAATMYASTTTGERTKRDLHWDDEDGARFLYPDGTSGIDNPFALFSCTTAGPIPPQFFTFLIPAAAAMLRRRKESAS